MTHCSAHLLPWQLTRGAKLPLTLRGMKDVDTLCFGVLEEHKLRLQPHPITTASKSTVNMFLVDLTGIVREFFGNIATQHLLDLHARFEGCQSATDDSRQARLHGPPRQ